ncbi:MAG: hypothetical protein ACRENB_12095 [Gemmatimonadales bacterium]
MTHSWFLVFAYAVACSAWWALSRALPLWPEVERPRFAHPWREVGIALVAVIATLGLGQLWAQGIRLPARGAAAPVVESVNQLIIFAPVLAVPLLRRHGWSSAWIRFDSLLARLAIGMGVALFTLFLYSTLERGGLPWPEAIKRVYTPARAHLAVQVLLEDVAIAILFVRLAAALGPRGATLGVAALFAASHIPTMIARGDPASELVGLLRDFGLGVLVLGTVWRSADIAWFWPAHYSLDMTQFLSSAA